MDLELYILNSLNQRIAIVELFESLIWTERFNQVGDFELHIQSNQSNRNIFTPGLKLTIKGSFRVMTVETVEDKTDTNGVRMLIVTGTSLENIMTQRLIANGLTDLTSDPKCIYSGLPADIARQMYADICTFGTVDAGDVIDAVISGVDSGLNPASTIDEPSSPIIYSFDPGPLYDVEKSLCSAYSMGFRIVRDPITTALFFEVYMGSDRTTGQTTLPPVVFSPDLENIASTSKLMSSAPYRNAAYVISKVGHTIVYPDGVDPAITGFERRVIFVKADDIDDPDPPTALAQMIQRGNEALAQARRVTALDGQLTPTTQFVYQRDYWLGDLVELRDDDGNTAFMQVTEHITVADGQGTRDYPTLTVNTFIYPGSWLAWDFNQVWDDLDSDPLEWEDA